MTAVDTTAVILAVASPPGRSLRGIVRLSGDGCFDLLAAHVRDPAVIRGRGVTRTRLLIDGLDMPAVVLSFPGPRSYTGENSAELQVPGNPVLLERLLDSLLDSGRLLGIDTRRAEPGEFTARAFFNGRMTLTQAEGVAAVIAAESDAQLRAGRLLCNGTLGTLARGLADQLADALALVEAGIDFTDQDDVVAIAPDDLRSRLASLCERIDDQLDRSVGTEQLAAIPWVVLTGEPNAGKSTLFNALLGRTRAVVSDMPGTTRDVLTEPLTIETAHGPAEVMLVDLDGAEASSSMINRKMQSAAAAALQHAELRLHCVPVNDQRDLSSDEQTIVVRTKADLGAASDPQSLSVSATAGQGIDTLKGRIAQSLADRVVSLASDALALGPRHERAFQCARRNLREAMELDQPELIAAAMRAALDDLSALAGDMTPDDVLGRIFATFCVGK